MQAEPKPTQGQNRCNHERSEICKWVTKEGCIMNGTERRKAKRREILENFSFYVQLPKIGPARHRIKDISESGIGFEVHTVGGSFLLQKNEKVDLHFFLNQSLFLNLKIEVVRIEMNGDDQQVGAVLLDTNTNQYQTYLTLVNFLDQLGDFGQETNQ
jgi:hypothetical protein